MALTKSVCWLLLPLTMNTDYSYRYSVCTVNATTQIYNTTVIGPSCDASIGSTYYRKVTAKPVFVTMYVVSCVRSTGRELVLNL